MEDGLVPKNENGNEDKAKQVLILIVVEDGLVLKMEMRTKQNNISLNPYCSGRWSRTGFSSLATNK